MFNRLPAQTCQPVHLLIHLHRLTRSQIRKHQCSKTRVHISLVTEQLQFCVAQPNTASCSIGYLVLLLCFDKQSFSLCMNLHLVLLLTTFPMDSTYYMSTSGRKINQKNKYKPMYAWKSLSPEVPRKNGAEVQFHLLTLRIDNRFLSSVV